MSPLGKLAMALERGQPEVAVLEVTEITALTDFLASPYGFDRAEKVTELYTKKVGKLAET